VDDGVVDPAVDTFLIDCGDLGLDCDSASSSSSLPVAKEVTTEDNV
jgi:hypothetical protein